MKDYIALWGEDPPDKNSLNLLTPITVIGERLHAGKSEFAKVQLSVHPAGGFNVVDSVTERSDLEKLEVGWPEPVIFGLLDVLMSAEPHPLRNVRVILERVWYHEVDSSRNAFRNAGRDAGRKVIEAFEGEAFQSVLK
jgi:translation elongation factor EF-G